MAKQATKTTKNNEKQGTPPVEIPPVETIPAVDAPIETLPVDEIQEQEDVNPEHQKKALEIMQKRNLNIVFYVNGYFFTKKEQAENAVKMYKGSKLETFKN